MSRLCAGGAFFVNAWTSPSLVLTTFTSPSKHKLLCSVLSPTIEFTTWKSPSHLQVPLSGRETPACCCTDREDFQHRFAYFCWQNEHLSMHMWCSQMKPQELVLHWRRMTVKGSRAVFRLPSMLLTAIKHVLKQKLLSSGAGSLLLLFASSLMGEAKQG